MRYLLLTVHLTSFLSWSHVFAQTDSTGAIGLRTFTVRPFLPYTRDEPDAARTQVDSTLLAGFERSSLRSALVWVPGVQMDERGRGGSSRLSIRGSLLRAPFGVRGVKVYMGPFPLTLADGSTPLELLDPMLVDQLIVDRQVGDPRFGSSPSGLVRAGLELPPAEGGVLQAEALGGPFGYYRLGVRGGAMSGHQGVQAGAVHQRNDGFRQQESTARDQVFVRTLWRHKRSTGEAFLTWQQARWDLPGGLDSLTAAQEPRSARPFAQLIDAHVAKQQLFGGIAVESPLGRMIILRTGVQAQRINKRNPYGNSPAASGDKEERITALGGRMTVEGHHSTGAVYWAWHAGLEVLAERDRLDEYAFTNAERDTLRVQADTRVGNLNGFAGLSASWARIALRLGAVTERTNYDHVDLLRTTQAQTSVGPAASPMASWEQRWTRSLSTSVRYATSVSRPTVWELLGTTGAFNQALLPERVQELQVGVFTSPDSMPVGMSLSLYRRWVDDLIVAQVDAADGSVGYTNAGKALLDGMEAEAHGTATRDRWTYQLAWFLTFQNHRLKRTDTLPERAVPGVVPMQMGLRARVLRAGTGQVEFGLRLLDATPLCLNCGDIAPGYLIAHLRVGWLPNADLEVFAHVENLFNADYSGFLQVDDPGRRYFNPAPPVGLYAGLRWSFRTPRKWG